MNPLRRLVLGLVAVFAGLAPLRFVGAELRPLAWFEGEWEVEYQDARLGPVRGQASVRVEVDGVILIRYVVKDPRDGAVHELTAFRIRAGESEVTLELPPGGPMAAPDPAGQPEAVGIAAPVGARLRARLSGREAEAPVVSLEARLATRLRLKREGDVLTGEWIVPRDANFGFEGGRSGTRGTVVTPLPGEVELKEEVVRGPETWRSARMALEEVRRVGWQDAPGGVAAGGIASVSLLGRSLPEPSRREVRFADPYLVAEAGALTGNVPVAIAPAALPGRKAVTIRDRATGQETTGHWGFDWPALPGGNLRFVRRTLSDTYDPTGALHPGELFYVEAEADRPAPGDYRLYVLESGAGSPLYVHLRRDAGGRRLFRAGPFLLLGPDDPVAAGAIEPPRPADNQTTPLSPTVEQPFLVRGSPGDRLRLSPALPVLGESHALALAEISEEQADEGPYQRALRQAESLRRRLPEPDRYDVSKFTPMSGSRRTHLTVQDHAALILLQRELLRSLGQLRRHVSDALAPAERRRYAAALGEAAEKRVELPLFAFPVAAPRGGERIGLNLAVYPPSLREAFGDDLAARDAYVDRAIAEAEAQLSEQAGRGALRLSQLDLERPVTLLPVIKAGYAVAAESLRPQLVRRSRPEVGEPEIPRWVPDLVGRAAVAGVADLLAAIAADEELADFQWMAVQVLALPAVVYTGALGAAGTLTRGAVAVGAAGDLLAGVGTVQNLTGLKDAYGRRGAAWDVAPVAGFDAYRAADEEIEARWKVAALDVPLTLLGAATLAGQLAKAGVKASASSGRAAVAAALEGGVEGLSDARRAQLALLVDSAARKIASGALDELSDLERAALRANFPRGLPASSARQLGLSTDNPVIAVLPDDGAVGVTTRLPPAEVPPARPPAAVEASPSSLVQRYYAEELKSARLGVPEAQGRLAQLERAAAVWGDLPAPMQGRAAEAMETFERMRQADPALRDLPSARALEFFSFHAHRRYYTGGVRDVQPEELVADFLQYHRGQVSPAALARAANISELNAEAAIFSARQRMPVPAAAPTPPSGRVRVTDPDAVTVGPAPAPPPPPAIVTGREAEIARQLERVGVTGLDARHAAGIHAVRDVDPRVAAAHAAMYRGIPARQVQDALAFSPADLRSALDDYMRRFDVLSGAERGRALDRYFGVEATVVPPRPVAAPPVTERNVPAGLAPPAPASAATADVVAALERMGVTRAETQLLRPEDIFPRGTVPDPRVAAARLARHLDVPAPRAARALGVSPTEHAALLDRAAATASPGRSGTARTADVAADLAADGVSQPAARVLAARQAEIDAALRDFGVLRGDPALTRSGLEPEALVVGQALESGVPATKVAARRGLPRATVEDYADAFLAEGRQVRDATERARQRTVLLRTSPVEPGPSAPTVRLSPAVLAHQEEVATALARLGVDPVIAGERAAHLVNLARRDAHEAIIGGAWQSRVPPAALRERFGYSNDQIVRHLDHFLAGHVGVRNPTVRANVIARQYFAAHDETLLASAVPGIVAATPPARQPLRAFAASPPGPVASLPPPRPLPAPRSLDDRFGRAVPPLGPRPGEQLPGGQWRRNTAVREVRPGTPVELQPGLRYNWLVTEDGRLLYAAEQYIMENGRPLLDEDGVMLRLGHPAMIDGGRARIAGELRHTSDRGWVLDNFSGRYSMLKPDKHPAHLDQAAALWREAGVRVVTVFQ